MYTVSGVKVAFGGTELFSNISFLVNQKDRIGLIGKNGVGKSTLLNLMAGFRTPDEGSIVIPKDKKVCYLPQELKITSNSTIYEEVSRAFLEITAIESEIKQINKFLQTTQDYESDEYMNQLNHLNDLNVRLGLIDESRHGGRIEKILQGLGFTEKDFSRKITEFSGGWQMRVELAKILLQKPDLILLDEPTNHLDIESILWLEDFLQNFQGAVVMVSHDKMFMDKVCNRTIELINGRIYDYKLTYSKFLEVREERLESQIATARNQQRYIEQQERFINRFRAKNTKAKQVKSKIKKLEKLERIEFDESDERSIGFRFPQAPRSGTIVLEAKNAGKKYGSLEVLNKLDFVIERGERIAFVGKNGEGKTTLVRMIMDEVEFSGELKKGFNLDTGYYAQIQQSGLDENRTVLQSIEDVATGDWANISKVRGLLGAFLFTENDTDKKVKVLSGGEKSRLALARLLLKPVNLLILDEPTNHLDISAKEVLKNALINYDGTLILVSHDRDFLQDLTNRTFEFTKKRIKEHPGSIKDFLLKHKVETFREFEQSLKKDSKAGGKQIDKAKESKEEYLQRKELEKEFRKLKNHVSKIEKEIGETETKIADIETKLSDPEFCENHEQVSKTGIHLSSLHENLNNLLVDWESKSTELEKMLKESE